MASSSPNKLTSLLLILLTFLFIQIHARESHFFNKVPNNNVDNFDAKETTHVANKVAVEPLTTPQDQQQQPNFIPQSQDNGYGLYGHESGQLPPNSDNKFSDPTTYNDNNYKRNDGAVLYKSESQKYYNNDDDNNYKRNNAVPYKSESQEYYNNNKNAVPYKSESQEYYNNNDNDDNNNYQRNGAVPYKQESQDYYKNNDDDNFQNGNSRNPYENSFYYNKDLYDNHRSRQSFHNTRLSRVDDFTTTPLYDQEKYDDNHNNNGRNANNNVVRHGMSDTRFMENGKYYYDLNREPRHYSTSRGNFGNNNNGNAFEYGNSMGRFQNDEAEFQEDPDEFVP